MPFKNISVEIAISIIPISFSVANMPLLPANFAIKLEDNRMNNDRIQLTIIANNQRWILLGS
jgi:hypothetical protein